MNVSYYWNIQCTVDILTILSEVLWQRKISLLKMILNDTNKGIVCRLFNDFFNYKSIKHINSILHAFYSSSLNTKITGLWPYDLNYKKCLFLLIYRFSKLRWKEQIVCHCFGDDISSRRSPKSSWICALCIVSSVSRLMFGYVGNHLHPSNDNIHAC